MSSRASGKRRGPPRANTSTTAANRRWRTPVIVAVALIVVAVGWAVAGAPLPGDETPVPAAADTLDGKVLYQAHCASCHGERGEGQPDWKNKKPDGTYPAPPHDPSGHTWHHADGLLFRIVRDGGQAAGGGAGFKSAMPAAGDTLSDAQIRATIEYIKTFWGPAERKSQANVSASDPYP